MSRESSSRNLSAVNGCTRIHLVERRKSLEDDRERNVRSHRLDRYERTIEFRYTDNGKKRKKKNGNSYRGEARSEAATWTLRNTSFR